MTLDLATLRQELLAHLGADISDFENGNTDLDLLLNRSWWDVQDQFDFIEKNIDKSFNTIADTDTYDLTVVVSEITLEAIQAVSVVDANGNLNALDLASHYYYDTHQNTLTPVYGVPEKYFRDNNNLILYPKPDNVYTINLHCLQTLADIAINGPPIPQAWHEVILFGGIWRGFARLGDYTRMAQSKATWGNLVEGRTSTKAKELVDIRTAGVSVLGRKY